MKSLYLLSLCEQNFNLYKHPRYIYEYFYFSFFFGDGFSSLQNGSGGTDIIILIYTLLLLLQ